MQLKLLNVNKGHFLEAAMAVPVPVMKTLRTISSLVTPVPIFATAHAHTQGVTSHQGDT